jgi:membrane associated rhomboid family serine protease
MGMETTPVATIIFVITIGLSLYTMYRDTSLFGKFILHPYSVVRDRRWHTIITSGFIHADLWHLMFNMVSFYFFAFSLENIVGSANFTIIYFGSMILGDIPSIIKHKEDYNYRSLGASGAISGVIYSFIIFFPMGTIYAFFIPMPAFVFAILFLVYGWYMSRRGMDYINHSAHNWGAVAGFVLTIILIPQSFNHLLSYFL